MPASDAVATPTPAPTVELGSTPVSDSGQASNLSLVDILTRDNPSNSGTANINQPANQPSDQPTNAQEPFKIDVEKVDEQYANESPSARETIKRLGAQIKDFETKVSGFESVNGFVETLGGAETAQPLIARIGEIGGVQGLNSALDLLQVASDPTPEAKGKFKSMVMSTPHGADIGSDLMFEAWDDPEQRMSLFRDAILEVAPGANIKDLTLDNLTILGQAIAAGLIDFDDYKTQVENAGMHAPVKLDQATQDRINSLENKVKETQGRLAQYEKKDADATVSAEDQAYDTAKTFYLDSVTKLISPEQKKFGLEVLPSDSEPVKMLKNVVHQGIMATLQSQLHANPQSGNNASSPAASLAHYIEKGYAPNNPMFAMQVNAMANRWVSNYIDQIAAISPMLTEVLKSYGGEPVREIIQAQQEPGAGGASSIATRNQQQNGSQQVPSLKDLVDRNFEAQSAANPYGR